MTNRRAVITGVGCVSGLGIGWRPLVDGLRSGRSAIAPIRNFDASQLPCTVGSEAPIGATAMTDLNWWRTFATPPQLAKISSLIGDGSTRDRKLGFAVLAGCEAWHHAGLSDNDGAAWLSLGVGIETAFFTDIATYIVDGSQPPCIDWQRDRTTTLPNYRLRSPLDKTGNAVAHTLGISGPVVLHVSACAAGALAVAHAASVIQRGYCDIVIAGASDSMLNPGGLGGMSMLGATSKRAQHNACRPFDRDRDGIAIGEGAALFVVEEKHRAVARGATILAEIVGWGSSQDAYRRSDPDPTGTFAAHAMQAALQRAGLSPNAIGYLNAHGTGTVLNDVAEAKAIRRVFGNHADDLPVSSTKGAIGHLMAACGAIELAATLATITDNFTPGTCHLENIDEECDIRVLGPEGLEQSIRYAQSNSFGFGGQNASVILGANHGE
jgi:3-oxoacyl-[acyl-carrier-protein] synthase II